MRVMEMAKQEFEKGNMLLVYICKYRRRLQFKKKHLRIRELILI